MPGVETPIHLFNYYMFLKSSNFGVKITPKVGRLICGCKNAVQYRFPDFGHHLGFMRETTPKVGVGTQSGFSNCRIAFVNTLPSMEVRSYSTTLACLRLLVQVSIRALASTHLSNSPPKRNDDDVADAIQNYWVLNP